MRVTRCAVAAFAVMTAWTAGSALGQEGPGAAIVERRALDHATRLEQAGRDDEAMRALENLLDEQPRSVSALVLLAQMAERAGEPGRALPRAEAAVQSDGATLPALRQVWVRTLQAAGLQDSALSVAGRWIEEDPTAVSGYLELSGLWARAGDGEKAIEALRAGRAAIGSTRVFVQELAALEADRGSYSAAAAEWRSMLAWGQPGVEAVERGISARAPARPEALAALRAELAAPESTVLECKGGLQLALLLGEAAWAREIVVRLLEATPGPEALDVLRDYVARARDAGDLAGAAWAAGLLVRRADSAEEVQYWRALQADLSYEAGDLAAARASFSLLLSEVSPGSDLYEISLRRLHELTVAEDPEGAESLLGDHLVQYPERNRAAVEMSVGSALAWLARGRLERARRAIALVPSADVEEAALQAAVLGQVEVLAGRPTAARVQLELAAAVPTGIPGTRIDALELLALVERADSTGLAELGRGVVTATGAGDPQPLVGSVTRWSVEMTPGGDGMASFAARELQAAGLSREAHAVRVAIVDGWAESPEAPRALLELARADRADDPTRAIEWLERLIVEYPESAMAPVARRLLVEARTEGEGA